MQSHLSKQNQDPFIILKNQRKILVRPKAKYVRKIPLPPRKNPKDTIPVNLDFKDFKNERKMTADSDIQNELNEPSFFADLPSIGNEKPSMNFISEETGNDSIFLRELQILDQVLPLDFRPTQMEEENLQANQSNQLIDFFSDQ